MEYSMLLLTDHTTPRAVITTQLHQPLSLPLPACKHIFRSQDGDSLCSGPFLTQLTFWSWNWDSYFSSQSGKHLLKS